jgi:hypothetical protein
MDVRNLHEVALLISAYVLFAERVVPGFLLETNLSAYLRDRIPIVVESYQLNNNLVET